MKLWRDLFGEEFHRDTVENKAAGSGLVRFSASEPWDGERFIDQAPYGFPVRINPAYRVRLTGRCLGLATGALKRRHGFRQFDLPTKGNRVPKNRELGFRAQVSGVPYPYDLYWKVRNGGREAADVHQLRGEITKDDGTMRKKETTSYKGSHFVECYIVKDGVVVATDHQQVIVT